MVKPGQNTNGLNWDIVIYWQLYTNTVRMARSQMSFHPDKCNVLRVTRCRNPLTHDYILHNQILKEKDAVKYLGVTVHHKMSWNEHICSIVKKANSSIGFLRRNLQIHQKHIKANAHVIGLPQG